MAFAVVNSALSSEFDWLASLADAEGLDFWTAPTGGTPMTAEQLDATIASGNCDMDVWASQDPADAGSSSPPVTLDYQGTDGDKEVADSTSVATVVPAVSLTMTTDAITTPTPVSGAGRTTTVIAGQMVSLQASLQAGGLPVTGKAWTVPGNPIRTTLDAVQRGGYAD